MDSIIADIWNSIRTDYVTKIILLAVIYFIIKLSKKVFNMGIYLESQDHAIEKVLANGKGTQYAEIRDKHKTKLKEKNNENKVFSNQ